MSHEVEQMFSVEKTPWHGLGHIIHKAPSVEEGIKLAGLDWKVEERQLYAYDHDQAGYTRVRSHKQLIRETDGQHLGVVGVNYTPLQNKEAFNFFNPFLSSGECSLETAGSLREGRRVWVLAKLNRDPISVVKGDEVEKFLMLSNGHDGLTAVKLGFTPIRVVCANTLAMSESSKSSHLLRLKHSAKVVSSLEKVREVVNTANQEFEATAEQYKAMARADVNAKDIEKFVKIVWFSNKEQTERRKLRIEKMTETITDLFETGYGSEIKKARGTVWSLYNAATQYLSYEAQTDDAQRLNNLWFGRNRKRNAEAFKVAVGMSTGGAI